MTPENYAALRAERLAEIRLRVKAALYDVTLVTELLGEVDRLRGEVVRLDNIVRTVVETLYHECNDECPQLDCVIASPDERAEYLRGWFDNDNALGGAS